MILFIDDEPHLLTEYDIELREAGFDVVWAEGPEEAMQFFLDNRDMIDAVILDIMMPAPAILGDGLTDYGMRTGVKILARIREETGRIPVMVFTNLSLSSLNLPNYNLVELREKRETPPFALPKLVAALINKAKEDLAMAEESKKGNESRFVIKGDVHAQQLYMGDHGSQSMNQGNWQSKEELLGAFFTDFRDFVDKQGLSENERNSVLHELEGVQQTMQLPDPDRTEVAAAVSRLDKLAPWAKSKFEQLVTGAAGSMLGAGIIAGVKFALGLG